MVNHKAIRRILVMLAVIAAINTALIAMLLPLSRTIAIGAVLVQVVVVVYLVVVAWKLLKLIKDDK